MTQNSVSFSCQSKQLSRYCINFPHELTCQILTNQSVKLDAERDQRVTMVKIEITSWLMSAYDFYSRVVKNRNSLVRCAHSFVCDSSQHYLFIYLFIFIFFTTLFCLFYKYWDFFQTIMTINSDKTMKLVLFTHTLKS